MDANQEKIAAERIHLEVSQAFNEMQEKKTRLQKSLKSVIHKTRYMICCDWISYHLLLHRHVGLIAPRELEWHVS